MNLYRSLALLLIISSQLSCTAPEKSNRIIVASAGKIDSVDPAQANTLSTLQLISALGDPLYRLTSKGYLEPRLANEEPEISSDGLTISIRLRENVFFHDGTPFNAEAMAFSLNRFIEIGTLNYVVNERIESIETPETYLIKIKLSRPSSSIKGFLTSLNLTPISPSRYGNLKERKFLSSEFVGTGPYKLTNFDGNKQRLEPNKNYWDKVPLNEGIDYINYKNSTSLYGAIRNGEIDVLLSNSLEDGQRLSLHKISEKGKLKEGNGPAMQIGYIALRSNSYPFNKKNIRKAISYSINRNVISKNVGFGLRAPLRSIVPPILKENQNSPWPIYNPEKARELLKKEGFCTQRKLTIPLTFRSNVPSDKLLALTWQQQLNKDLSDCLVLNLNGVQSTTIYKQLSEGSYDSVILGWTGDYPDPHAYLSPLLDCKKIDSAKQICLEGEAVYGGTFWASKEIQEALDKTEILTGIERVNKLDQVESMAAEGSAIIPIWLLNPTAWSRNHINKPEFDGNGRLILELLKKELNE